MNRTRWPVTPTACWRVSPAASCWPFPEHCLPAGRASRPAIRFAGNCSVSIRPGSGFAERTGPLRILVLGGSQGARILNRKVPEGLARLEAECTVLHQAGRSDAREVESAYRRLGVKSNVRDFIVDMAQVYAWADVAVCRAGALTLAELSVVGLGAILVPFALAADDHQTRNARYLVSRGAALLIAERDLSAAALAQTVEEFAANRASALARALRARELARPDATDEVVKACLRARAGA